MMFNRGFELAGRCLENGIGFMRGGHGLFMMGGMVLAAVVVIAAIVVLVRKAHKRNTYSETTSEAAELLNARFVKGEITEEEYTKMKKVLSGK